MSDTPKLPTHLYRDKNGTIRHKVSDALFEVYEGRWRKVLNRDRSGWWRFHDHYDRNGYCDNPARGY